MTKKSNILKQITIRKCYLKIFNSRLKILFAGVCLSVIDEKGAGGDRQVFDRGTTNGMEKERNIKRDVH